MGNNKIRIAVDSFYNKISKGEEKIKVDSKQLSKSFGYEEKLLNELPEEVNLGLSCGNPLAHFKLNEGETLLDLGCGLGMDLFLTRMKYPNAGTLYGLDRLDNMIKRASIIRDKKKLKNIEFIKGSLINMPIESNSIDKIISNCVINLEPEKQKVYDEIYRVLRENGQIIISDTVIKQTLPEEWMKSEKLHCSCISGAISKDELLDILKNSGFKTYEVIIEEVTDEYAMKWGYGLDIKDYICRGLIKATK